MCTVEIPEALCSELRVIEQERGATVEALVLDAVAHWLDEEREVRVGPVSS